MKAQISRLNAMYVDGVCTYEFYKIEVEKLLRFVDWQKRIQFENMLFTSFVK